MARSLDIIKAEIEGEVGKYAALSDLEANPSKNKIWGTIKNVLAVLIRLIEAMIDQHKAEIAEQINNVAVGTIEWYVQKMKEYQQGGTLVVQDGTVRYSVVDPSQRIIKSVSAYILKDDLESTGQKSDVLALSVQKEDGDVFVKLTDVERNAVTAYLDKIKFAGVKTFVFSLMSDIVTYDFEIYVDPRVAVDVSNTLPFANWPEAMQTALVDYHKKLDGKGTYYQSKVVDALQGVPGVVDVVIKSVASYGFFIDNDRKYPAMRHKEQANSSSAVVGAGTTAKFSYI